MKRGELSFLGRTEEVKLSFLRSRGVEGEENVAFCHCCSESVVVAAAAVCACVCACFVGRASLASSVTHDRVHGCQTRCCCSVLLFPRWQNREEAPCVGSVERALRPRRRERPSMAESALGVYINGRIKRRIIRSYTVLRRH